MMHKDRRNGLSPCICLTGRFCAQFASIDAVAGGAQLVTRVLRFAGTHLFVNAIGSLSVELLSAESDAVLATSHPWSGDSTRAELFFDAPLNRTLQPFASRGVYTARIRVLLRPSAKVFALWVAANSCGASEGFVSMGGPGMDGPTDSTGSCGSTVK